MNQLTLTFTTHESSIIGDPRCDMTCTIQDTDVPDSKPVKLGGFRFVQLFLDGSGTLRGKIGSASSLAQPWEGDVELAAPGITVVPPTLLGRELDPFCKELERVRADAHCIFVDTPTLGAMQMTPAAWRAGGTMEEQHTTGIQGYWEGLPVFLKEGMDFHWVIL